jgi:hypothetical protein
MSLLQPPESLTASDQAVYDAIRLRDEWAFQQHFPRMCVDDAIMGHALALGIVHDAAFVLTELQRPGSRLHPSFRVGNIKEMAQLALTHHRDAWLVPLFKTLRGPLQGQTVTAVLTTLVEQGEVEAVQTMLAQPLPMAEAFAAARPAEVAIAAGHLAMVGLFWEHLAMDRHPHWATFLVVAALADAVTPSMRAFVLQRCNNEGLLEVTLTQAAFKNYAHGLKDWWAEIQRRQLTLPQADVDMALSLAAGQGAEASVSFLLNTLSPPANPANRKAGALQTALSQGHLGVVQQLVSRLDVVDVAKMLMRRKMQAYGDAVTPEDNLAHVNLMASVCDEAQQTALTAYFGERLVLTQARRRQAQAQQKMPAVRRTRMRS